MTVESMLGLAFSPDGTRLACRFGDQDHTVVVRELTTGKETLRLKGHIAEVSSVALNYNGTRLAEAADDGTVRVIDTETGQETLTLQRHTLPVSSVAFSPDGRTLACASWDGTVSVWDATPASSENLARDDALRLIRYQLERVTSEAELRSSILGDLTISERTRAIALTMARGFFANQVRRQAESQVALEFGRLLLRADVLDSLRADSTMSPEVRTTALALAETWHESAKALNDSAWTTVRNPNRPESDYRRGFRMAEAACRLEPDQGSFVNTLGVAHYRIGQYQKALDTLQRSSKLNGGSQPEDLAFLAMIHHRLNQPESARAMLGQLRDVLEGPDTVASEQNQGLLREVESVISDIHELPISVFAP
jgi:hypothetical protein